MQTRSHVWMITAYTQWADDVMLSNAERLAPRELSAPRQALFGSIAGTFDHILVVAEIFSAHLDGRAHAHTDRRRDVVLPFTEIAPRLRDINTHFVSLARSWTEEERDKVIDFKFVGGGEGSMSRAQILLHLCNHATYHRGFISTLLYPLISRSDPSDLTVFLRDHWPAIASDPQLDQ